MHRATTHLLVGPRAYSPGETLAADIDPKRLAELVRQGHAVEAPAAETADAPPAAETATVPPRHRGRPGPRP